MLLPNIIFAENHQDPITGKILEKILPNLIALGYRCFFDEAGKSNTMENLFKKWDPLWQELHALLKINEGIDLDNPECLDHDFFKNQGEKAVQFIQMRRAHSTLRSFFAALEKNNIDYKGIDLDYNISVDEMFKTLADRDRQMATEYSSAKQPVFGRVGLLHVQGIQSEMTSRCRLKFAKASSLFINIYSTPIMDDIEKYTRADRINYRLGIITLDATKLTEDEIINHIINNIMEKKQQLHALEKNGELDNPWMPKLTTNFFHKDTTIFLPVSSSLETLSIHSPLRISQLLILNKESLLKYCERSSQFAMLILQEDKLRIKILAGDLDWKNNVIGLIENKYKNDDSIVNICTQLKVDLIQEPHHLFTNNVTPRQIFLN